MNLSAAKVSSVEALEAFRANLIIYLNKARPTIEEADAEITRTRSWLQNEQRTRCEGEVQRRTRALKEAEQALFSAKMTNLREATSEEMAAVHQRKRELELAEEKLRTLKRWTQNFENQVVPLAKQLGKIESVLGHDLPKAVHYLAAVVKTLDAYAATKPALENEGSAPEIAASAETAASAPPPPPASGEEKS